MLISGTLAKQLVPSFLFFFLFNVILYYSSSSDVRTLTGHSGPVYSISFNNDNTFLCSASEDTTSKLTCSITLSYICYQQFGYGVFKHLQLWYVLRVTIIQSGELSLGIALTIVIRYYGISSPLGYYFVSCSNDRTARLWTTEHILPARIFAGHSSDVDVFLVMINIVLLLTNSLVLQISS